MVSCGSYIYVFGGCPAVGRLADLHQLDTETGVWSQLPSGDMEVCGRARGSFKNITGGMVGGSRHLFILQGRGGTPLTVSPDGSSLFVVGGFAGREMADIHRFDIASKTWKKEEQVRMCVVINSTIYQRT